MSDTPETDAAWAVESGNGLNEVKEISRKLERELDEALMDRNNGDIATMTINHYERILRERDEAREALDCLLAVIGLTPITGNREALQEVVDQGLVVLRKLKDTK